MKIIRKKSIIPKFFCKTLNTNNNMGQAIERAMSNLSNSEIIYYLDFTFKYFAMIFITHIITLVVIMLIAVIYIYCV